MRSSSSGCFVFCQELFTVGREEMYLTQKGEGAQAQGKSDRVRRVIGCATMWHETEDETMQMLKSIFRMDADQCARRIAQEHMDIVDPDYYEFESKILLLLK